MEHLDTTNVILAVIAATGVIQLVIMVAVLAWFARQFAQLKREFAQLRSRTEGFMGIVADLRSVAARAEGVGRELEKVGVLLQDMVKVIGAEVHRATDGLRVAMDLIQAAYHGASSVGETLKSSLKDIVEHRFRRSDTPDAPSTDPSEKPGDPFPKA